MHNYGVWRNRLWQHVLVFHPLHCLEPAEHGELLGDSHVTHLADVRTVHLCQLVHWCGCREFLLCLPNDRRRKVDHARGDARVQEGLGRVREPEDRLLGAAELRPLLWGTS